MSTRDNLYFDSMALMAPHVQAHIARQNSKVEKQYGKAMLASAAVLKNLAESGDFNAILKVEKDLQQQDLEKYSTNETVRMNVLDGIEDLEKGIADYNTLMKSPEAYKVKAYVRRDMTGRDRAVPLDAMRKALRSQASRVRNYARNPMANDAERAFHTARMKMIRQAEQLYDGIQREQLSGDNVYGAVGVGEVEDV